MLCEVLIIVWFIVANERNPYHASPTTNVSAYEINVIFGLCNRSIASAALSRPVPDCLVAAEGLARRHVVKWFTQTTPASRRRAVWRA